MRSKKLLFCLGMILCMALCAQPASADFTFAVTSDQREYTGPGGYDNANYFRGAMEALAARGAGAFMLSPGDIDPVDENKWTIEQVLGAAYPWYPVVGNHELPGDGSESYYGANMDYLRAYDYDPNGPGNPPDIFNSGPSGCPETTFSFDYETPNERKKVVLYF